MYTTAPSRAATFLQMYRVLEGALERRFAERRSSSVIMDYLHDDDSEPFRYELNLCREIRNLLSHNADDAGQPPVEPSTAVLDALQRILDHVTAPRLAVDCGTPREKLLCAHPNDLAIDVMRRMFKRGYSHVPVMVQNAIVGIFSADSLFAQLAEDGPGALRPDTRIDALKHTLVPKCPGAQRYLFLPRETTITQVRAAFDARSARNSRLSAVFITANGASNEPLLAMLTPWDVLKDPEDSEE